MTLTVRLFGLEFLHIEASTEDQADTDPGDCTTSPVGFVHSPSDQRWESVPEFYP